jgi:hypothetical protein
MLAGTRRARSAGVARPDENPKNLPAISPRIPHFRKNRCAPRSRPAQHGGIYRGTARALALTSATGEGPRTADDQ